MRLNSKGVLARFYSWSYVENVPVDLCTFFWGLVGAVLMLPFTAWSAVFPFAGPYRDMGERFGAGLVAWILLFVLGGLSLAVYTAPLTVVSVIAGVVGVVGIMALIIYLREGETPQEIRDVVRERVKGLKGKYCPRIEWK